MDGILSLIILFILLYSINLAHGVLTEEPTKTRLRRDLFKHYSKLDRPVYQEDNTVQVKLNLELQQLIDLDEPAQIMTAKWLMWMYWKDQYLMWNPEDYDNITKFFAHAEDVWTPDIMIRSSVDEKRPVWIIDRKTIVRVRNKGQVGWKPFLILKSACDIHVEDFPFDVQRCTVALYPEAYRQKQVNYTLFSWADDQELEWVTHSLWDVLYEKCTRDVYREDGYVYINCAVYMKRKSMFYMFNLLLPLLVLLIIGCLCFFMPINEGGRVGLSVTVLLSMTVFLIMIMNNLPATSDGVPHLQKFISMSMIILGASTVACVAIIGMYNRSTGDPGTGSDEKAMIHKPPYILVFIYLKVLAKIGFLDYSKEWSLYKVARKKFKKMQSGTKEDAEQNEDGNKENLKLEEGQLTVPEDEQVQNVREVFKRVWIATAVVLNRMCLYAYIICTVSMVIFAVSKASRGSNQEEEDGE